MAIGGIPAFGAGAPPSSTAASDYVRSLQSRLIAKPKGVVGINGFLFDYAGEVRVENHAEITDHFAEDNTAINDHVAIKPVRITMRGFVAELAQTRSQAQGLFGSLQNLLTTVPAYLGKKTPGAVGKVQKAITQAQNIENQINKAIAQGQSVLNLFKKGAPTQTKQQKAYAELEALMGANVDNPYARPQLFDVETPYKVFKNMVIETLIPVQSEDSKSLSDFTVILKQMRFAAVVATPNFLSKFGGRAAFMNQGATNVGKTPGTKVSNSIAFDLFSGGAQ